MQKHLFQQLLFIKSLNSEEKYLHIDFNFANKLLK